MGERSYIEDEEDETVDKPEVNVFMSTPLYEKGEREMTYNASDMLELMEILFFDHDKLENLVIDNGYIADYVNIFLNDRQIEKEYSNIEEIELEDNDEVSIIASVSGGKELSVSGAGLVAEKTEEDKEGSLDEISLKEYLVNILEAKDDGEIDFHQRQDQRLPISMIHDMLSKLNSDEIHQIFQKYKDMFTPSILGATSGQNYRFRSSTSATVEFVKKLKPEDKAFMAKQEIKSKGTFNKYNHDRYRPNLDIDYNVESKEFFEELTALQSAKFILGIGNKSTKKIVDNIGIDYFKNKMKKLIFRDSDGRAEKALSFLKEFA